MSTAYVASSTPRTVQPACDNQRMMTMKGWRHETVLPDQRLALDLIKAMFHGDIPGIRVPAFFKQDELSEIIRNIEEVRGSTERYSGIELGSLLGIPSHWEFHYGGRLWTDYFPKVAAANAVRKRIFAQTGDPVEIVQSWFSAVWQGPVLLARHPSTGRELYAGIIRSGAPKLHIDWAHFDIPGFDAVMQAGWSFHLQNPGPGGDLRVYRKLGMDAGNSIDSGESIIGNYDFPKDLVEDVESDLIPCRPGDWVITPNRFFHEVTSCPEPDKRITVAAHIAWMGDGSLRQFS